MIKSKDVRCALRALDTGLFAKHGLDIHELLYISSSAQGTTALLSGSVDAAVVGGIGIMSAVHDTTPIRTPPNSMQPGSAALDIAGLGWRSRPGGRM